MMKPTIVLISLVLAASAKSWSKEELQKAIKAGKKKEKLNPNDFCEPAKNHMNDKSNLIDRDVSKIISNYLKDEHSEEPLGIGTYSSVFKLNFDGKPAAVKIIDRQDNEEFLPTELFYWVKAYVNFPDDFPAFLACLQDENVVYIISELMDGNLLKDLDKRHLDWNMSQRLSLFQEIAKIFEHLHSIGIIHQDIKPDNIFVKGTDQLSVKVGDFGLAHGEELNVNELGTEGYIAPEVIEGFDASYEADVYSLAITFWKMFSFGTEIDCTNLEVNECFDGTRKLMISFFTNVYQYNPPVEGLTIDKAKNVMELIYCMMEFEEEARPNMTMVIAAIERIRKLEGTKFDI